VRVEYTRMFHDADGASHLEELTRDLTPADFSPPAEPGHLAEFLEGAGTLFFGAEPPWSGETPHPSPQRQIFCLMRGTAEVTMSDGATRRFRPGDLVIVDDTEGVGHSTRIVGEETIAFFGVVLADQTPRPGPTPE